MYNMGIRKHHIWKISRKFDKFLTLSLWSTTARISQMYIYFPDFWRYFKFFMGIPRRENPHKDISGSPTVLSTSAEKRTLPAPGSSSDTWSVWGPEAFLTSSHLSAFQSPVCRVPLVKPACSYEKFRLSRLWSRLWQHRDPLLIKNPLECSLFYFARGHLSLIELVYEKGILQWIL